MARNSLTALSLNGILLGQPSAPATFVRKQDASQEAKRLGWQANDVIRAANRFQAFWVVGQVADAEGNYRLLSNDGQFRLFGMAYKVF